VEDAAAGRDAEAAAAAREAARDVAAEWGAAGAGVPVPEETAYALIAVKLSLINRESPVLI